MILQNFVTVDKFRLQTHVCKNAGTPSMLQWSTRTIRLTSTTKSSKNWTTFILNPRLKKKRHRESEKENEKRNQLSLSGWTTLVQTKEEWKRRRNWINELIFCESCTNIYNLYTIKQYTCNMGSDIHREGYIPIENTALDDFLFESTRGVEKN